MTRKTILLWLSVAVMVGLLAALSSSVDDSSTGFGQKPIVLYCAASNRAVIEAIRADYEAETGRKIHVQYGASQTLLSSIEVSRTGDLYLPADDSYLAIAAQKNLVAEQLSIATMQVVIGVQKGNPKQISSLADLLRSDVRFVQASPDATAVGRITRETLLVTGQWESLAAATSAYRMTVNDVANDLIVGAADAGIIYDVLLHSYPKLGAVEVPELRSVVSRVSIGVVAATEQPAAALHFARYVTSEDRGLKRYREQGFAVERGGRWEDISELHVYAGAPPRY